MKTTKILGLLLIIVALGTSSLALAADTATQTVTIQVDSVNDITVSGDPAPLIATSATPATDNSTTYDLTTNGTGLKITGEIDTDVPADTTLTVELTAPTGATSLNAVALSTTPADLVTGIGTLSETGLEIAYEFSALASAGTVASQTRTVTFTI